MENAEHLNRAERRPEWALRSEQLGRVAGRLTRRWMPAAREAANKAANKAAKAGAGIDPAQMGRVAGRAAQQWIPNSAQTGQFAKKSGLFVKHVLPAAVKPVHSLWHQILGFFFLLFAMGGAWRIYTHRGTLPPAQLAIVVIFIVIMAGYGISSIRKSRRISRS